MNKLYTILFVFLGGLSSTTVIWAQETQVDSLRYYTEIALANNPGVQAQRLAYEAFLEKIPQAGAFEDPELSMGFYTKPMDIVGGRQIGDLTLMQMLPWFGTKKSAKKEANHMASMQMQQYREAQEAVILQVHTQWYVLQKLQQQVHNAQQNKKLLEQVEQLALQRFSSPSGATASNSMASTSTTTASTTNAGASSMGGMAMGGNTATATTNTSTPTSSSSSSMTSMSGGGGSGMSDVLRIRLETIEVENTIESLQAQIKAEKIKFNALLDQEAQTLVTVPQKIEKVAFFMTDADVQSAIETNNPMLAMLTEEGLAYQAKAEMDRKMSYPMVGLGVQYMIIGKTNDPMLAMGNMNGKDMIMPMVTLSLPVFRKKYKAQQEEGKKWWQSSEAKYKDTYNTLLASYYSFKNQVEDTERTISLLEKQTTLAETTFNLIVKEFVTGKSDLTNVIQVQRQLLDYQLKKAEAIATYNTLVASIENITATTNDL